MRYTLLLSILFCSSAQAQVVTKFYYNKHWELTTEDSAVYLRTTSYDTTKGVFTNEVTDTDVSGKTLMTGYYRFNKKNGVFKFYYGNGQVESTGAFVGNQRSGTWTYYYPNGKEKMVVDYSPGSQKTIAYLKDSTGTYLLTKGTGNWVETYEIYRAPQKITVRGEFKDHKKHGRWTCVMGSNTRLYDETFKDGIFVKGYTYPNGNQRQSFTPHDNLLEVPYKFHVTENFFAAKGVDFKSYPLLLRYSYEGQTFENSRYGSRKKDKIYITADTPPVAPVSADQLAKEVAAEIRYPPEVRRSGIQGDVFVQFVIDEDGTLYEVSVYRSSMNTELDLEAIRAVKLVIDRYQWEAALVGGKHVKFRYPPIPVRFRTETRRR